MAILGKSYEATRTMTYFKKLTRGALMALAIALAAPLGGIGDPLVGVAQAQEQRLVASVLFEGNNGFSDAQLSDMINVTSRGSFSDSSLANDVETIRLAYVGKGYTNVRVSTRLEQAPNGRTRVTIVVDEGERVGIAAINFTGNNSINAGTLKSVIRTRETHLLSWLFRDDAYSEDLLQVDRQLIELYYMNHGYPDAVVTSAVGEFDSTRGAYFVNFTINEGERYKFGTIGVETSIDGLNADALTGTIRTSTGGIYSLAQLQKSQEDMAFEATAQGYAFADVRPRIDRDVASSTFNITYLVDQGARIYVERINITGNEKTRDAVIRRELDFGEGDPFNRSMVSRGKSNIEKLGFFKTVSLDFAPGSAADKVVININVEEQSTGDYGLTAGYDSSAGLLGEISVTERNFLGKGQYVRVSVGASESGQTFDFSFTEPRFMGLRVSSGVDIYHRISNETESNMYGTTSTGGQLRFGVPITSDVRGSVFVGLEQKTLQDDLSPFSDVFDATTADGDDVVQDTWNKAWVGYTLNYNTLDDAKRPTEGIIASFTQQYIGIDHSLLKTEAKARYFMSIMPDAGIVGSVKGQAGFIYSFDGAVSPLEAFRSSSGIVRGFQSNAFGPRYLGPNPGTEALGYTGYLAASAEIEFPIPVLPETYGVRGSVWADAALIDGNGSSLSPDPLSVDENFKSSVGASVIWDSPFGPLRGDFAYVINKATDDKTQVFSLTLQNLL
jgi:outer membrane protein insertion porin family